MAPGRIVAIGTSTGGLSALQSLVGGLPADFAAPLLVVQHVGRHPSMLPEFLARAGPLPSSHARDGDRALPGHVHVAPPDRHMLLEADGTLRLSTGPKENHTRPAIDPLFRSVALAAGARAIGVVLTGRLDDGTAGLQAIKQCGGVAIVQSPEDAEHPGMPRSALRHAAPDHCLPLAAIANALVQLAREPAGPPQPPQGQARWAREHRLGEAPEGVMDELRALARPSTFTCPDCAGALWEITGSHPPRFRCHTGHAFSPDTLRHAQGATADEALWAALRALQEKQMLLEQVAAAEVDEAQAARVREGAREIADLAGRLRNLLQNPGAGP